MQKWFDLFKYSKCFDTSVKYHLDFFEKWSQNVLGKTNIIWLIDVLEIKSVVLNLNLDRKKKKYIYIVLLSFTVVSEMVSLIDY